MLKRKVFRLRVSLCLKFKAPRLVKVKAYKRWRYGKVENIRSYYRIVWDDKITERTVSIRCSKRPAAWEGRVSALPSFADSYSCEYFLWPVKNLRMIE